MNILFNPKDGSTLFTLGNGDAWLFKFGIQMVMMNAHQYREMIVPEITKEFLENLTKETEPKIRFDPVFIPFVRALVGEVMSEMEPQEIDARSLSKMLAAMDKWLVGDDFCGTTTLQ